MTNCEANNYKDTALEGY